MKINRHKLWLAKYYRLVGCAILIFAHCSVNSQPIPVKPFDCKRVANYAYFCGAISPRISNSLPLVSPQTADPYNGHTIFPNQDYVLGYSYQYGDPKNAPNCDLAPTINTFTVLPLYGVATWTNEVVTNGQTTIPPECGTSATVAVLHYKWTSANPLDKRDTFNWDSLLPLTGQTVSYWTWMDVSYLSINDQTNIGAGVINGELFGPYFPESQGGPLGGPLEYDFLGSGSVAKITLPNVKISSSSPMPINFAFNRSLIPKGKYTSVQGKWTSDMSLAPLLSPIYIPPKPLNPFNVLGLVHYTQYNAPKESACSGQYVQKYVYSSLATCSYFVANVKSDFASQTNLNGTGYSNNLGILKTGSATALNTGSCSTQRPAGSSIDDLFVQVSSVTGSCGTSMVANTTVATWPKNCRANYTLVDKNGTNFGPTKIGSDTCPACRTHPPGTDDHIDSWSDANLCSGSGVGDLGNFWTLQF